VRGNRIGGKQLDIARRGDGLRLWRSDRTLIEGNTIHDGRDAILWYSKGIVVRGNTGRLPLRPAPDVQRRRDHHGQRVHGTRWAST
jgi:parallel beta-helix repeat protein